MYWKHDELKKLQSKMWRCAVKFIGTYLLSHLKFIVSNVFVDKECTENWWNSYTIKLVL